jgi:hypothetical protein
MQVHASSDAIKKFCQRAYKPGVIDHNLVPVLAKTNGLDKLMVQQLKLQCNEHALAHLSAAILT